MKRPLAFLAAFKPSNTDRPAMMELLLYGMGCVLMLLAFMLYLLLGGPVPGAPA